MSQSDSIGWTRAVTVCRSSDVHETAQNKVGWSGSFGRANPRTSNQFAG